ncbi:CHAT domain-containing protein [Streptomyces luteogriseus]|uniref:CHAT domain-containing protein n=1 Tax=Streptomyces luteogriseus TaxID=68233 RepID=UPI00378DFBE2
MTEPDHLSALRTRLIAFESQPESPDVLLDGRALLEAAGALRALMSSAATPGSVEVRMPREALLVLSLFHWYRYLLLRDGGQEGGSDLTVAVELFDTLHAWYPDDVPPELRPTIQQRQEGRDHPRLDYGAVCHGQASALLLAFAKAPDIQLLNTAILLYHDALRTLPQDHPETAVYRANLAAAWLSRFHPSQDLKDLETAVAVSRAGLRTPTSDEPVRISLLYQLHAASTELCARKEEVSNLDTAIDAAQSLLHLPQDPRIDYGELRDDLLRHLIARFDVTGAAGDLDDAIALGSQGSDDPERPDLRVRRLLRLTESYMRRFQVHRRPQDVMECVGSSEAGLAGLDDEDRSREPLLSMLMWAMARRYRISHDPADVDKLIDVGRAALGTHTLSTEALIAVTTNVAAACQLRWQITGSMDHLHEALEICERALELCPPDNPNRPAALSNYGITKHGLFEHTGDPADVDTAVDSLRQAVELNDAADQAAAMASNLGGALEARYRRSGDLKDLEEALTFHRTAVRVTPETDTERATYLNNLGAGLVGKYRRTGAKALLDEAIETAAASVEVTHASDNRRAMHLQNLSVAHSLRHELLHRAEDLEAALSAARDAVRLTDPEHNDLPDRLTALGLLLQKRFAEHRNPDDLNDSLRAHMAACRTPRHPNRPLYLSNLAVNLLILHVDQKVPGALAEAERMIRLALSTTPPDHYLRHTLTMNLAVTLATRHHDTGDSATAREAIAAFRTVSRATSAPALTRMEAGSRWGSLCAGIGDRSGALEGYTAAIQQLHIAAWHGWERTDRLRILQRVRGLACDAAAAAIDAGRPEDALLLLEQGRGVVLGQALNLRSDRTRLRSWLPKVAARMDAIRSELDGLHATAAWAAESAGVVNPPAGTGGGLGERREELAQEWDGLVRDVQASGIPELDDFFRLPTPADMRRAARHGPVAVVNISRHRCDVLLVTAEGPLQVFELSQVTAADVTRRAEALQAALADASGPAPRLRDVMRANRTTEATLGWLWDTVALQVTDAVCADRPDTPQRLWWCPTGPAVFLPWHAAGRHDSAGVLDRTVSSYTPTLRALAEADAAAARRVTERAGSGALLAVAVPRTPGYRDLPQAEAEYAMLRELVRDHTPLVGARATRRAILGRLPDHRWWHFAGHGAQDVQDATGAALFPYDAADGPITIADIAALPLEGAHLAFLSACETARGSLDLPDEAVHVAGALQLAGFIHVVATQWHVDDARSVDIARQFYRSLLANGDGDGVGRRGPEIPAAALRDAMRDLRARHPRAPVLWAPYTHTGPDL